MRDPKRIKRILDKLEIVWNDSPDWRLGQLIENMRVDSNLEYECDTNVFFIEDDLIVKNLNWRVEYIENEKTIAD